ncbi:MAG: aspartate kinase [Methanobrevibacter sp.]|uniref:aspartate kinase n=1 Tax=Methanobrevibacter sp. TaxID=66852 RepID=UPI0025E32A95|nr:aspartate kinase [Methanobrevibacter sp.]MBR6994160.1 aspartate kinase [Methanobrevibacter sp.]
MSLIVAKFGGTSVGNGERIKKAAQSVADEYFKDNQIIVVVSAVNKTTDDLISLTNDAITNNLTYKQHAEIVGMGERTSVRLFSATLESLGVKSIYVDPYCEAWPIITDSNYMEAKIDVKTTDRKIKELKTILDQGIVPVVCGFLGKCNDQVTTLGRGGSDITAFLIGECLNADEVIIVTDVDGVLSTDPRKINEAELLEDITVGEMKTLATHGAQVLHPNALDYKHPDIDAKIINFKYGDLTTRGTHITGPYDYKPMELLETPVTSITVVGKDLLHKSGIISDLTNMLYDNGIHLYKLNPHHNSITTFINKEDGEKTYKLFHKYVIENDFLSSISQGQDTAMISIIDPERDESEISRILSINQIDAELINIAKTEILIFVDWELGEKVFRLLSK